MKVLLEEASRMLKSLNQRSEAPSTTSATSSVEGLQKQLDRLKTRHPSAKALRLTKMSTSLEGACALLDSGATHPLRGIQASDCSDSLQKVHVNLANGHAVQMLMNAAGVMISTQPDIEVILPLGWLTARGCQVTWLDGQIKVQHPSRGCLPVEVHGGCPQIPRSLALELLAEYELEELQRLIRKLQRSDDPGEKVAGEQEMWLRSVVDQHPILRDLPDHVKQELALEPLVRTPGEQTSSEEVEGWFPAPPICRRT